MKKLGLQFFDIEKLLNLEDGELKEINGVPFLVQRKDPIEFDKNNIPKRTWVLEGVSREWEIDITLQASQKEIDLLKDSE